jgi:hypothetical protein
MSDVNYLIREYPLQQGALEIAYIEEFFNEFPERKTAAEIMQRLDGREYQILMAEAVLPEDGATVVPVSYKVSHELRPTESSGCATSSTSTIRRSSTTGSARRGSTGAARATFAR